jgi:hypothetical protein
MLNKSTEVRMKCTALTLGKNEPLSNLPLSQTVFGFTLSYLSYFIATSNLTLQNIPMFIVMSVVILADMLWNVQNSCMDAKYLGLALLLGSAFGVFWAYFIETNAPSVAYYSGLDKNTCNVASKGIYRCRSTSTPTGRPVAS